MNLVTGLSKIFVATLSIIGSPLAAERCPGADFEYIAEGTGSFRWLYYSDYQYHILEQGTEIGLMRVRRGRNEPLPELFSDPTEQAEICEIVFQVGRYSSSNDEMWIKIRGRLDNGDLVDGTLVAQLTDPPLSETSSVRFAIVRIFPRGESGRYYSIHLNPPATLRTVVMIGIDFHAEQPDAE
jgi:hypothetical protein